MARTCTLAWTTKQVHSAISPAPAVDPSLARCSTSSSFVLLGWESWDGQSGLEQIPCHTPVMCLSCKPIMFCCLEHR